MAAASMKNAYSPSSFLTLQVFRLCYNPSFSYFYPFAIEFSPFLHCTFSLGFFSAWPKDSDGFRRFLCDFFFLSGPPYCTHVDVYLIPRHACFITIIMITLSKPSLLLLVITLGFVDSMKAFNLAYVGMVELYKGQFETNTFCNLDKYSLV